MDIKRLKELRKERSLNQKDIAEALGFSQQRYQFYESGRNEPDNDTLIKIANFFEVSADYLLGISDNPRPSMSKYWSIENGYYVERTYTESTGKNEVKIIASTEMTPMETAAAFFYAQKGRYPTDEELDMFMAFTKPVLDSLPDKAD